MSEQTSVRAIRVRLRQPGPCGGGRIGSDWVDGKGISDLVVFPGTKVARCRIPDADGQERTYVGDIAWAEVDSSEFEAWEKGSGHHCSQCGRWFETSQGLGSHVSLVHQKGKAKK